jgi:hypothetical protein
MAEVAPIYSIAGKRIFVSGDRGMVGSALVRRLAAEPCQILTAARDELDLRRQAETEAGVKAKRPDVVVIAAARVGGILANDSYPAEFLYDNLMIEANLIRAPRLASKSCFSSARPASIRAWRRRRSRRTRDSPVRSSRPTNGTPSPRLSGSSSARPIAASTATISSRRCRQIFTGLATITMRGPAMCCRP